MVNYTEKELFSITDFTKQISSLLKDVKSNTLNKIGVLKNNRLEAVVLSTAEYARLKQIEDEVKSTQWTYWKDEELENFGKIAIGLSRNDYDENAIKRAINVTINSDLLQKAKAYKINISKNFEAYLAEVVKKRKEEEWLEENKDAIDAVNKRIKKHGCFSEQYRRF